VCENGTYETNGAVPIPNRPRVSFTGLARAAGYPKTYEFSTLDEWERALDGGLLKEDGPILVDLKMQPGEKYPEDFRRLYNTEYREAFKKALAK